MKLAEKLKRIKLISEKLFIGYANQANDKKSLEYTITMSIFEATAFVNEFEKFENAFLANSGKVENEIS